MHASLRFRYLALAVPVYSMPDYAVAVIFTNDKYARIAAAGTLAIGGSLH